MVINKALFSSNKQGWGTPPELFMALNKEFNFKMDAATTEDNPLGTEYYYTKDMDGLAQENRWISPIYINPPYGRDIKKWVARASMEMVMNRAVSVMLLPARTDTKWFHTYLYDLKEDHYREGIRVKFLKGRLRMFDYETDSYSKNTAPFPSMIVVFKLQC